MEFDHMYHALKYAFSQKKEDSALKGKHWFLQSFSGQLRKSYSVIFFYILSPTLPLFSNCYTNHCWPAGQRTFNNKKKKKFSDRKEEHLGINSTVVLGYLQLPQTKLHLYGFDCYTMSLERCTNLWFFSFKVQEPRLYCLWKVQKKNQLSNPN